ncbi:unnamed protein product [Pedinophyceae sp. YPF-701]|nr:unnamed protein product [Pedinophyceae sp. YPF-701]
MAELEFEYDRQLRMTADIIKESLRADGTEEDVAKRIVARTAAELPDLPRGTIDNALRSVLCDLIGDASAANEPVMHFRPSPESPPLVPRLLGASMHIVDAGAAESPYHVFILIEDTLEMGSVADCSDIFRHIDSNMPALRKYAHVSRLVLLRICNKLIRRVPRAEAPELCGKVLLLVARLFPLTEKSGVNLSSALNGGHPVAAEAVPEADADGPPRDTTGQPINGEFYGTFWALQGHFQKPPHPANSTPAQWAAMVAGIRAVLDHFGKESATVDSDGVSTVGSGLNGYYLTSPSLFNLQMRDSAFRRHFLAQCLFVLLDIRATASRETRRPTPPKAAGRPPEKPAALSAKQTKELNELEARVWSQLELTGPRARAFAAYLRTLVARESFWASWKFSDAQDKSCADFELPAMPTLEVAGAGGDWEDGKAVVSLGNEMLDDLWRVWGDNVEDLGAEDRGVRKALSDFADTVAAQMDPDFGLEEDEKVKNHPGFKWRALRLLAAEDLVAYFTVMQGRKANQASGEPATAPGDLELMLRLKFPEKAPEDVQEQWRKWDAAAAAARQAPKGGGEKAPGGGQGGAAKPAEAGMDVQEGKKADGEEGKAEPDA